MSSGTRVTGLAGVQSASPGRCQIPHLKDYELEMVPGTRVLVPVSYRFAQAGSSSGISYMRRYCTSRYCTASVFGKCKFSCYFAVSRNSRGLCCRV